MRIGNIVEFIDRQKIVCAVIIDLKGGRMHLITESNREINLSPKRLSHHTDVVLDTSAGRDRIVGSIKEIVARRTALTEQINIQELWEVLNTEQDWVDLSTLTGLCFPKTPDGDHEAAMVRALFEQRHYFKFDHGRFFPNSESKIKQLQMQEEEEALRQQAVENGRHWLKGVIDHPRPTFTEREQVYIDILKDYYLLGKESPTFEMARNILPDSGFESPEKVFRLLVKLGGWKTDENIDLIRLEIPTRFHAEAEMDAAALTQRHVASPCRSTHGDMRKDLTHLPIFTIDGQATLDFDDAISVEDLGGSYRIGIHITDVAEIIGKETPLDLEARSRGSSIYMPDQRIPMIPPALSEDLCSLRAGEIRPAVSILADLNPMGGVLNWEVIPSWVRVKDQLSYQDANLISAQDARLQILVNMARHYREIRLNQGALQITLPEIHIHVDEKGEVFIGRINRESPSRFAVAEIMILANALMAAFLRERNIPAVFRSQPGPKERLFSGDGGTLFQNWMQRKLISRYVLGPVAEPHSGLGLDAYVTGTSPIRKYFDLITQRQIRAVFGIEELYSPQEIEALIVELEPAMANVAVVQARRGRYWLLKYLEKRIGEKEEAVVLGRTRNGYQVLLQDYMLECRVPVPSSLELKSEDVIRITLQNVDARNDVISIFMS